MNEQQAWYDGWAVLQKGGGGSGNWGHTGYPGIGGSSRGTGLSAIGAKPDSTLDERRKLSAAKRKKPSGKEGDKKKPRSPPDMSKRSQKQHREAIGVLAKKPLKDLRKRQRLVASQRKRGLRQLKEAKDPVVKARLERGLRNLDVMDKYLTTAIDQKVFGA